MGSSVGARLFVSHGWRASAGVMLGWTTCILVVLLARGPHCGRYTWFGYEGGKEWRKIAVEELTPDVEKESQVVVTEEAPKDEKHGSGGMPPKRLGDSND